MFVCLITAQEHQSPRWDFISFVSTKMPDALDDKCEGDSPEQFSIQPWSHTRDSLARMFQPKTERESGRKKPDFHFQVSFSFKEHQSAFQDITKEEFINIHKVSLLTQHTSKGLKVENY